MARQPKLTAVTSRLDRLPVEQQAAIRASVADAPPLTAEQAALLRRVFARAEPPTTPTTRAPRKALAP
jgi:hypothetical protein